LKETITFLEILVKYGFVVPIFCLKNIWDLEKVGWDLGGWFWVIFRCDGTWNTKHDSQEGVLQFFIIKKYREKSLINIARK